MAVPKGYRVRAHCHKEREHYAHGLCSPCYQHKRYHEDPEPARARLRARYRRGGLQKNYGISAADYEAIRHQQGARCAICDGGPIGREHFDIDHDHATGNIRGLLCTNCNGGLGKFHDDPAILQSAIDYLATNHIFHGVPFPNV